MFHPPGPLPQSKRASPDRAPPTPYSLVASSLHVTMPSMPSPDRTLNTTPAMLSYRGKSPMPTLPKSSAAGSPSPLPSEDFVSQWVGLRILLDMPLALLIYLNMLRPLPGMRIFLFKQEFLFCTPNLCNLINF